MDLFLASFFLLDEFWMVIIGIFLVIAGWIVGLVFLDVQTKFRRITYLWFLAIANFIFMACQFGWLFIPSAATAGLFSALVISLFSSFFLFGGVVYYGSAARSNHKIGSTKEAWFGMFPILNLLLILGRGKIVPDLEVEKRPWLSRFVVDPLLVLGAIGIFVVGQGLEEVLDESAIVRDDDGVALQVLLDRSQTLEESFARQAVGTVEMLPVDIDEITVLSAIEAQGNTLHLTFDVKVDLRDMGVDFVQDIVDAQCAPEMFGYDISRGGRIEFIFRGRDKHVLTTGEITQVDCSG